MPIYGYECKRCGHQLEVLQSLSEAPLRVCPECEGELRKLLYPVGVIFKGSGFYSTDYKGSSSNGRSSGDSSESKPAAEGKSDSTSETKSESKADSKSDGKSGSKPDAKPAAD